MKKKILSISLILGILQMILCSIPVSAADDLMRTLPYAFYDCEDGVTGIKTTTIGTEGMGESAKCMVYTENTATNNDRLIHIGDDSTPLSGTVPAGYKFTVSFYLKIPQKLTPGQFLLLINHTDVSTGETANTYPDATFDGENTTDWQKIEFTYTPSSDITLNRVSLRFGHHGSVANTVVGASATTPRTYYIDDLTVSVVSPDLKPPAGSKGDSLNSLNDYSMTFENGSSLSSYISGPGWSSASDEPLSIGSDAMQLVSDPENGMNKVMKLDLATNTKSFNLTFRNVTGTGGGPDTIVGGSVPVDHRMVYTFRYRFAQEMNASNGEINGVTYLPGFCISLGSNRFATTSDVLSASADEWHEVKLIYTNDTAEEQAISDASFRVGGANNDGKEKYKQWVAAGHNGYDEATNTYDLGERTIYFDDLKCYIEKAPLSDRIVELDNYRMTFENGGSLAIYTNQWSSATPVEQVSSAGFKMQIVADPEDGENKVMKVTLPTNMSGASGNACMILRNTTNLGGALSAATGTIPSGSRVVYTFRYYLGQAVNTHTTSNGTDYLPAFCVHNTGGGFATSEEVMNTAAGEWHTATLTYTNDTSSAQSITQAQFRFAGDNSDGKEKYKNWVVQGHNGYDGSTEDYGERVFYIDDFKAFILAEGEDIPEEVPEDTPDDTDEPDPILFPITNDISIAGEFKEGNKITFNHDFTPSDGAAADKSLVRLMHTTKSGVKASLSSCIVGNSFTVPKLPESGSLIFEVIPVDDAGVLGYTQTYRFAQLTGQEIRLELSDFDDDGNVTARVTIDNQRFDGKDINAVLIVEMLNEKGAVVKFAEMPLVCANGSIITGEDGTLTLASDNADPALSKVTKAIALIWDCGDEAIPSTDNTLMEELVVDVSVEKQ